ncbi:iron ABC transporter permease [Metasolibacillus meyeri]|uniref:Iron ABC transporter permease n=1 Tax=Metasolibacillus meyeri TaxID=1071052 RepID=A0AAW9NMA4_9BACL|nr:iron ABC transporter permease [Metasolibacillus meyeri]MEC1178500.1 iron ABC transporter permease [Metasolibacillus meyeri]
MKYWNVRLFQNKASFQLSKKWFVTCIIGLLLLLVLFMLSLSAGSNWISPIDVLRQLFNQTDEFTFVIETLRLPRVLIAILVGSALGVSGLILQSIVRNPLASPDIIGITSGASFGAVLFLTLATGVISMSFLPVAAICGGLVTAVIIYLLSWNKGVTPVRLVLIGIGISAILKSGVTFLLVYSDTYIASKAYIWLTGSLYATTWQEVISLSWWLLIPLPIILILGRSMNVTELGDDVAISTGIRLQRQRFLFLACAVLLAGSSAAFVGGIEFVGLMAPHIARRLVGRSFLGLVPITAIIGALLVLVADLIARTMFLPLDIPAGVFTAAIGAPFFIFLLFRTRNR